MNKLTTVMVVVGIATAMVLVLVGAPMVVPAAEATNVFCGQTLTQDTKLNGDLTCSGDALRIEADNVTLDLGGFTITGNSGPFPFAGAGVFVGDRTGVTIKNGTIQNFRHGVSANNPLKLTVSGLIINDNQTGVLINVGGEDVVIRNSSFLSPPASSGCDGAFAIHFDGTTKVDVDNVDIHGGIEGVTVDCGTCDGSLPPTTGKIRNSTFTGTHLGVVIWNTTDLTISNNHFSNIVANEFCGSGDAILSPGPSGPHPRTGIKIRNNFIHDNTAGIGLLAVVAGAEIKGNQVRDNIAFGIVLHQRDGTPSTGNVIKNNITSGNGLDLSHDGSSFSNTWKNNSCENKDGADIPEC